MDRQEACEILRNVAFLSNEKDAPRIEEAVNKAVFTMMTMDSIINVLNESIKYMYELSFMGQNYAVQLRAYEQVKEIIDELLKEGVKRDNRSTSEKDTIE